MNNLMKRIMSVAMAAITTTSPILSSYTIYASDITVSDDGTITQMSTSTDSSMSEADETKFLFIKLKTAGGKVVLNEGEDQEQRIRLDKKMDGAEYIDVYDKNDVLISSESTKDNGYTYVYEAKADDAVNVKAKADEGYTVKLYELTDDSSGTEIAEDVGFDAGNKVEAFKYPVFMEYDKTVKIGFEKKESAEDIAEDLSVNDEAVKEKSAKAEETAGQLEETEEEVDAIKAEDLEAEHVKADDEGAEAEMNGDTESEDTKNAEDAGISKKSENTKDIGSNDKQDVSEEAAKGDDLAVNADGNKEDNEDANITVNDNDINKNIDENTEEESEEKSGEDIMGNDGVSEDTKDAGSDNPDETADTTSEGAKVVESPAPDEISSNTDEDSITNDAKTEEADSKTDDTKDKLESDKQDIEQSYDISNLDSAVFSSARLVVISDDAESISDDSKYIIANYQNIYLIQYETVEDAMVAYIKYSNNSHISAVEPDAIISAASNELLTNEDEQEYINENVNPMNFIYEENESTRINSNTKLIALIDTGVSANNNVTNRVSVIDESFEGNGHGNEMLKSILEQNPNANVLSIRAIDDNGHGNISGIVAAIEYALNQGAEIINLSISSRTTILNSVLESEIKKAVNSGVAVIAAAGNDGDDVKDYMPGSVNEAVVIGACNENGERLGSSNYGYTVDYNVVADSTSQAAAKYSGYISSHDYIDLNSGLIFSPDYSEMIADNDKKQLRAYYMLYDQTRPDPDEHTKYVFSTFNIYYPIEQTVNNMMLFKINPNASRYDYNANGITIDIDINRGAPEGHQHPITNECIYDEKTGYLSIPEQYKEEDLTVTIWQSREDAFYKDFIPDEVKPQEDQTGMMTIARFANDFPYGYINPSYAYKGCNANVKLKGDPDSVKVGDLWTGSATTMYIGDTDWGAQVPYGWVAGSEAYGKEWRWGQIFNITSCQNKMFVNIGGAGEYGKSSKNWLCKDADAITTITSGDDGMTDIAKILVPNSEQEKTFYCKETKAPQGKIIKETIFPLTFKKADYTAPDGELKTFGPKEGIINDEGWKVRVNAKKVDGDKKGLAGAKFTVYDNESLSNESILGVLESSADGTTNELSLGFNMNITEVTLYCQETTPPDGYIGTDEIFKVTFKKADYDKLKAQDANTKGELKTFSTEIVNVSVTPTPTISVTPTPPTPPSGGLYVKKTSKAPKDIMDLKSYTLADAEYRVTSSRAGDMGTLTTDESGYSNVLSLPDNSIPHHQDEIRDIHGNLIQEAKDWIEKVQTTYYITEIKAPNYHSVYAGTKSQSVVMPDDAGQTFEIPFENEPIFCDGKLDIEKLGVKGEVVVGAVFKVEYFDADGPNEGDLVRTWYLKSDTQGHVRMDEAHLDKNNQSDDFFKYDGNIVIPIGGYLQITEVDAPAEYVVETEPVGIATTKDADFKLTYDNAKAWYEELERCRVNLKKYEADGKTPIAGVEFEIKFLKQAIAPTSKMHPNFKRLLKEGESTIRHTDENGDVFFDNLDQGIYQITEIKTLDGNSLLKEPIIVTLPMTMTEDEANEYGNVNYETAKEDVNYSGKWYFYECLYEITNNAVFKMPMTGDDGRWKYGFIGLGIVMAISAGFVICNTKSKKTKKRKHRR